MKNKIIKDEEGIYTDCFAFQEPTGRGKKKKCIALNGFYNAENNRKEKCHGCPFYKVEVNEGK